MGKETVFVDEDGNLKSKEEQAALKEEQARIDLIEKRQVDDLNAVLESLQGRRFLWRLLSEAKVFNSVVDSDPIRMGYRSGKQDLGHWLMAEIIKVDPDRYIEMMQEANIQE